MSHFWVAMEEDRAQTDIGQAIDAELVMKDDAVRLPRKRFTGRRAERLGQNSTIEESSAITSIQTSRYMYVIC